MRRSSSNKTKMPELRQQLCRRLFRKQKLRGTVMLKLLPRNKHIKPPLRPRRRPGKQPVLKQKKMVKKVKEPVQKVAKLQKSRKG